MSCSMQMDEKRTQWTQEWDLRWKHIDEQGEPVYSIAVEDLQLPHVRVSRSEYNELRNNLALNPASWVMVCSAYIRQAEYDELVQAKAILTAPDEPPSVQQSDWPSVSAVGNWLNDLPNRLVENIHTQEHPAIEAALCTPARWDAPTGYRRASINISQDEYQRLRDAEIKFRNLPDIPPQHDIPTAPAVPDLVPPEFTHFYRVALSIRHHPWLRDAQRVLRGRRDLPEIDIQNHPAGPVCVLSRDEYIQLARAYQAAIQPAARINQHSAAELRRQRFEEQQRRDREARPQIPAPEATHEWSEAERMADWELATLRAESTDLQKERAEFEETKRTINQAIADARADGQNITELRKMVVERISSLGLSEPTLRELLDRMGYSEEE